jgi:hypothetical protein
MHMRLVLLIHVADAQCRLLGIGNAGDSVTWQPDDRVLKRLSISHADLASWNSEMKTAVEQAQGMLELAD